LNKAQIDGIVAFNMSDEGLLGEGEWFVPPEGVLEGTDLDIAMRFVDGMQADYEYRNSRHPRDENDARGWATAGPKTKEMIDDWRQKLTTGNDEDFVRLVAGMMRKEVRELNDGERSTITGQQHLFAERQRKIGHIWAVIRPDLPQE